MVSLSYDLCIEIQGWRSQKQNGPLPTSQVNNCRCVADHNAEAADVEPRRRRLPPGTASVLFNASRKIGVALGLAVLSTISISVTASRLPDALGALYRARGQR